MNILELLSKALSPEALKQLTSGPLGVVVIIAIAGAALVSLYLSIVPKRAKIPEGAQRIIYAFFALCVAIMVIAAWIIGSAPPPSSPTPAISTVQLGEIQGHLKDIQKDVAGIQGDIVTLEVQNAAIMAQSSIGTNVRAIQNSLNNMSDHVTEALTIHP